MTDYVSFYRQDPRTLRRSQRFWYEWETGTRPFTSALSALLVLSGPGALVVDRATNDGGWSADRLDNWYLFLLLFIPLYLALSAVCRRRAREVWTLFWVYGDGDVRIDIMRRILRLPDDVAEREQLRSVMVQAHDEDDLEMIDTIKTWIGQIERSRAQLLAARRAARRKTGVANDVRALIEKTDHETRALQELTREVA